MSVPLQASIRASPDLNILELLSAHEAVSILVFLEAGP